MCRVIEEMRKQEYADGKAEGQLALLHYLLCNGNLNFEQAAESIDVSVTELMDRFKSKGYSRS